MTPRVPKRNWSGNYEYRAAGVLDPSFGASVGTTRAAVTRFAAWWPRRRGCVIQAAEDNVSVFVASGIAARRCGSSGARAPPAVERVVARIEATLVPFAVRSHQDKVTSLRTHVVGGA